MNSKTVEQEEKEGRRGKYQDTSERDDEGATATDACDGDSGDGGVECREKVMAIGRRVNAHLEHDIVK